MSGAEHPGRRWKLLLLLGAAVALLLVLLVNASRRGRGATSRPQSPAAPSASGASPAPAAVDREARGRAAPPTPAHDPSAPIIDKILVEKPEVCEGEENLVTVEAHDPRGDSTGLRYLVNGTPGASVPVRARNNTEDPTAPPRVVLVVGPTGATTTVPIPPYTIKRCAPAARLRMRHFLLPNATAEYRFEAKLIRGVSPGQPRPDRFENEDFTPTRYTWNFGDGEQTTTTMPYVTHSYEFRDQSTYFTYHLLSVTASDDRGRTEVARDSLEIMNPAYEELAQKQIVKLMTLNTPRFPELVDGKVIQTVRIWHFRKEEVPIDGITAYFFDVNGKEMGSGPVQPVAMLGVGAVPPGAGLTIRTVLEVAQHPDVGFITYELRGTAAGGLRASGAFSIMRPPDGPTRDKHIPVGDPMMAAKIKRAMELLGKQTVTDEDIWELERQGKFEGLQPIPVVPGDQGPPSWLPRQPRSDGEPWSPDDDPGPPAPDDNASAPDER